MIRRGHFVLCCCGTVAVMLAGCGGGSGGGNVTLAEAGGTVTFKGSPLAGAIVTFVPETGPIALATTDLAGKFKLSTGAIPGAAVGESTVTVSLVEAGAAGANNEVAPPKSKEEADAYFKKQHEMVTKAYKGGAPGGSTGPKSLIPERYAKKETSKLTFKVDKDPSKNQFAINLEE